MAQVPQLPDVGASMMPMHGASGPRHNFYGAVTGTSPTPDVAPSKKRRGVEDQFPYALHRLLSDDSFKDVITWCPSGKAFRIESKSEFERVVLLSSGYFNQTKYKSFLRQMNMWGFATKRGGNEKGCHFHEYFIRGEVDLCAHMKRIKIKEVGKKSQKNRQGDILHHHHHHHHPHHQHPPAESERVDRSILPVTLSDLYQSEDNLKRESENGWSGTAVDPPAQVSESQVGVARYSTNGSQSSVPEHNPTWPTTVASFHQVAHSNETLSPSAFPQTTATHPAHRSIQQKMVHSYFPDFVVPNNDTRAGERHEMADTAKQSTSMPSAASAPKKCPPRPTLPTPVVVPAPVAGLEASLQAKLPFSTVPVHRISAHRSIVDYESIRNVDCKPQAFTALPPTRTSSADGQPQTVGVSKSDHPMTDSTSRYNPIVNGVDYRGNVIDYPAATFAGTVQPHFDCFSIGKVDHGNDPNSLMCPIPMNSVLNLQSDQIRLLRGFCFNDPSSRRSFSSVTSRCHVGSGAEFDECSQLDEDFDMDFDRIRPMDSIDRTFDWERQDDTHLADSSQFNQLPSVPRHQSSHSRIRKDEETDSSESSSLSEEMVHEMDSVSFLGF